jgi:surface protein
MFGMFYQSKFNSDISQWDVSNVNDMESMFEYSNFNKDISKWKINTNCDIRHMFADCNINKNYIPKTLDKIF